MFIAFDYMASYLSPNLTPDKLPREAYFEYDPFLMWKLVPGYKSDDIHVDGHGFRTALSKIPEGALYFIGGSTVFGLGVKDGQAVSSYFSAIANEGHSGAVVVNAGVTGYFSTQEFIHIIRDILKFKPSRIVAVTGRNDVFYSLNPGYIDNYVTYHGLIRKDVGALDPYSEQNPAELHRYPHLLRSMGRILQGRFNWSKEFDRGNLVCNRNAYETFLRNQIAIYGMLSSLGIQYDLFLQPLVDMPERALSAQEQKFTHVPYYSSLKSGYEDFVSYVNSNLSDASWYHGCIPLTGNDLFIDNVHFSPKGAMQAAAYIHSRLDASKINRSTPGSQAEQTAQTIFDRLGVQ